MADASETTVEEVAEPRQWVYGKNGESKIVTVKEAEALYKTNLWADHPDHFKKRVAAAEKKLEAPKKTKEQANYMPADGEKKEKVARDKTYNLKQMSRDELVALCITMGIDPPNRANKEELKKIIRAGRVKEKADEV